MSRSIRDGRRPGWLLKLVIVALGLSIIVFVASSALQYRPFDPVPRLPIASRSSARVPAIVLPENTRNHVRALLQKVERIKTPPLTRTDNILLVGLDRRRGARKRAIGISRTDALLVVVMDRMTRHIGIISVPRDLLVSIPGHDQIRINTVFGVQHTLAASRAGALMLRRTITSVIGLPISHAVFVDHAGFEELIDSLGGIDVQVRCPIRDNFIDRRSPTGRRMLTLQSGLQHMTGETALMFSRSRHGRGVTDRARRQQAVIAGIRERLVQLGLKKAVELWPLLAKTVFTDLTVGEMISLGRRLIETPRTKIHGLVLRWLHVTPIVTADGRWVMLPKPKAIASAVSQLFKNRSPGFKNVAQCKPMDAALTSVKRRSRRR